MQNVCRFPRIRKRKRYSMDAHKKQADAITADDLADAAELGVTVATRLTATPLPNYAPTSKTPKLGRHARKSFKKPAVRSGFARRRAKKIQW